jgi:hypothetical protein
LALILWSGDADIAPILDTIQLSMVDGDMAFS